VLVRSIPTLLLIIGFFWLRLHGWVFDIAFFSLEKMYTVTLEDMPRGVDSWWVGEGKRRCGIRLVYLIKPKGNH
jgi:hypothetical protein